MNLNEKLAKALDNALNFKGVTVYDRNLKTIIYLDEEDENYEVGIHCTAIDSNSFLWTIKNMLEKGQIELKLKENTEEPNKYIEYLKDLDV